MMRTMPETSRTTGHRRLWTGRGLQLLELQPRQNCSFEKRLSSSCTGSDIFANLSGFALASHVFPNILQKCFKDYTNNLEMFFSKRGAKRNVEGELTSTFSMITSLSCFGSSILLFLHEPFSFTLISIKKLHYASIFRS